jgi:hypothetical protein
LSSTGLGDGKYPIFAEMINGYVVALHIQFHPDYCLADDPEVMKKIEKNEAAHLKTMYEELYRAVKRDTNLTLNETRRKEARQLSSELRNTNPNP